MIGGTAAVQAASPVTLVVNILAWTVTVNILRSLRGVVNYLWLMGKAMEIAKNIISVQCPHAIKLPDVVCVKGL